MSTRKTTKTLATKLPSNGKAVRKAGKRAQQTASTLVDKAFAYLPELPKNSEKYIVPGAAALGTGLVATAAWAMKKPLTNLMRGALEGAVKGTLSAAEDVGLGNLLAQVGLRRKRSYAPWIGGAVVGVAVASALTVWLAPKLRGKAKSVVGAAKDVVSHETEALGGLQNSVRSTVDGIRDDLSRRNAIHAP